MSTKKGFASIKRGFTVEKTIRCTRLRALFYVFVSVMLSYTPADRSFLVIDTLTPNNRSQKSHTNQLILTIMDSEVRWSHLGISGRSSLGSPETVDPKRER